MIDLRITEDPVLEELTRTIVERIRPRRIVLFGSRARGDAEADSDYDIMVEVDADADVKSAERVASGLFPRRRWSMDVLVYAAADVQRWKDDVGFVLYDIVREGRVLYCRPDIDTTEFGPGGSRPAPRVREGTSTPESLQSWIDRARSDFAAMKVTATLVPPVHGIVCFHAHQCADKLLKACLIARSIRPPRIHDLPELLALCVEAGFDLAHLGTDCATLYGLWLKSRYPEEGEPTSSEADGAVEAATAVRSAIQPLLQRSG
jgi:uncharacterized protein